MIIKGLLAILILLIIPVLIGYLYIRFLKKEKNNIFLAIVLGYFTEFALLQLITVPMIFLETSFTTLLYVYFGTVGVICVTSIILNIKKFKEIIKDNINNIKTFPKYLVVISVVLILLQVYGFVGYAHIDDDDAFYVATSTVTVQTDTIYKYSPSLGGTEGGDYTMLRYRLAPFPVFAAMISKVIDIHPVIVSHVIIPIIFVPIVYMIYGLIANELFKENKKDVFLFLIIMAVLHIFGGYSIRTNFAFLLFRIWQGKSVLANMIIPAVILFFIKADKNNFSFMYCLLMFIVLLAGTFTTTMGIGLPPIVLMLLCTTFELLKINFKDIKNNNYKLLIINFSKCLVCCIPCIVYAAKYFLG